MLFAFLFRRRGLTDASYRLYDRIVRAARQSDFYRNLEVPDSVEGRFEMIALHAFLVLQRLKKEERARRAADELGQAVFDLMFADMDRNMREMGVGDLSVGPRVKALARAFYGRIAAYEAGLGLPDDTTFATAIQRNIYGGRATSASVDALTRYTRASADILASISFKAVMDGDIAFASIPLAAPVISREETAL